MRPKILITGISGQDGTILTKLYLDKGYNVTGIVSGKVRQQFILDSKILKAIKNKKLSILYDSKVLTDKHKLQDLISTLKPLIVFHLASKHRSQMDKDFENKNLEAMLHSGVLATKNLISTIKHSSKSTKLIVAASSKIYSPSKIKDWKNENSIMNPLDNYGQIKRDMRILCQESRKNGDVNCGTAILFNHDSVYNRPSYLGWTIANQVLKALAKKADYCTLSDLRAMGDFSHAEDVCLGMARMADMEELKDFVFGSGKIITTGEILRQSLNNFNLKEVGIKESNSNWEQKMALGADITLAKKDLEWKPKKSILDAINEMVIQSQSFNEAHKPS